MTRHVDTGVKRGSTPPEHIPFFRIRGGEIMMIEKEKEEIGNEYWS